MAESPKPIDPKIQVMDELSSRLSRGADFANKMRIDLYVGDLVTVVAGAGDMEEAELLEQIKSSDSFINLSTNYRITDETTLTLVREVKAKLGGLV